MAAVLLTTSCSKDEDNNDAVKPDTTKQANTETEQQGVPFTIKVVTGKKLSKIAYEDKGATVQPSFSESDVDNLIMFLSPAKDPTSMSYGNLTLKNVNGTFKGELWPEPEEGTEILVELYAGDGYDESSTESLTDLMEKCQHKYEGKFTYGSGNEVKLTDQNAYFEIFMSPLQHKLSAKMYNEEKTFDVNTENGKVWIVVEKGFSFETNFYSKKSPEAGTIYTIDRSGYVDLGLPNGTLWADKNVGATTYDDADDYYTFEEAQKLKDITLPTSGENSDFELLKTQCTWVYQDGGFYVFKSQKDGDKGQSSTSFGSYSTDYHPYIFLPCAGEVRNGETSITLKGSYGFYWSGSAKDDYNAYCLAINYSDMMEYITISSNLNNDKLDKFTIRSVLQKSKD